MNARALTGIIIVNLIIIALVVSTLKTEREDRVIADPGSEEADVTESVHVVIDDDLPYSRYMDDVGMALSCFSPKTVQSFNSNGWRIIISKELDFSNSEYFRCPEAEKTKIIGFADYKDRVIRVKVGSRVNEHITDEIILCMCYFVDHANGYLSDTDEYSGIISVNPDFIEKCNFCNILSPTNHDYFAYAMREYLTDPESLRNVYPSVYAYYESHF